MTIISIIEFHLIYEIVRILLLLGNNKQYVCLFVINILIKIILVPRNSIIIYYC